MFFSKCPIGCSSELVKSDIALPEGTLLRCASCGQLVSSADEAVYLETMRRFDDSGRIDTNPRIHLKRLSRLERYWPGEPEKTRVLDVGSSFGLFLKILKNCGYDASGVEPSKSAAAKCVEEGLDVYCGFLEDISFPDNSFDVLTMYEVIEHLKAPRPLLEECYRVLKKGGMMFLSTGNTDSWSVRYLKGKWDYFSMYDGGQGHISFFNPRSISRLAVEAGFRVVAIESRRLKLVNKKYDKGVKYLLGKAAQEAISAPAKLLNKGHDMLVVLAK